MTGTLKDQFDYIVVGAGAAGSVLAAELSATGAQVLVIESGGPDDAPTIAPALVQPTSRGAVRLASGKFQDAAVIDGNYLGTNHDFAAVLRAIEAARELGSQKAFDNLRESELIPGPKSSAEEIQEFSRLASASFGLAVGTCKMGVDKLAVVDPELRVYGILGLRVADGSVMPRIITGPGTNAAAHMIGGRATQLIRASAGI